MSRRRLLGLTAGAGALALGTSACGSSTPTGRVTLRFAWWGGDARNEYTHEIISVYEQENQHVRIESDYTGWSDYWDRLATNVAGGRAPDIIQHDARFVREYADNEVLLRLNRYLSEVIDTRDLDRSAMDSTAIGQDMYALPVGSNALCLAANPEIFHRANVPLPNSATWTWQDFAEITQRISDGTENGVYGVEAPPAAADTLFEIYARQRGEALYAESGGAGFTQRTADEWWRYLTGLVRSGAAPPPSITVETSLAGLEQTLVGTNKAAMGFFWNNQLPLLSEASGTDLHILRIPGDARQQPGTYLKNGMFWSIAAGTRNPVEAARFVNFLVNDPRVADLMLVDRSLPANLRLRERVLHQLPPADRSYAQFIPEIEDSVQSPPELPPAGAGEVEEVTRRVNEKVLFGRMSVPEGIDQFSSELRVATG
ncbi:ABC transporter substrate-binding protein [Salinifilum aidingensis]